MESRLSLNEVSLRPHPALELFPMRTDAEIEALAEDIRLNGLKERIDIYQNMILDGRTRMLACLRAGVRPQCRYLNGSVSSPSLYVLEKNGINRGWTEDQRAAFANVVKTIVQQDMKQQQALENVPDHIRRNGATRHLITQALGISLRLYRFASVVQRRDPEAFAKLLAGEVSLNDAYKQVRPAKQPRVSKKTEPLLPTAHRMQQLNTIRDLAAAGHRSDQIAEALNIRAELVRSVARRAKIRLPDDLIGRTRRIDVNRIIDQTVLSATGMTAGLDLIDTRLADIDPSRIDQWVRSLRRSIRTLNDLITTLKNRRVANENENHNR